MATDWLARVRELGAGTVGASCPVCHLTSAVRAGSLVTRGWCRCDPQDTVTLDELKTAHGLETVNFIPNGGYPVG